MVDGDEHFAHQVAALVSEHTDGAVSLTKFPLGNVGRLTIRSADRTERSWVVKWLRQSIDPGLASEFLHTERAALSFLDELGLSIAPALTAATSEFIVTQDFRHGHRLWEMLRDDDPLAAGAYRDFARVLARLHTSTLGASGLWTEARLRVGLAPVSLGSQSTDVVPWRWGLRAFDAVGIEPSTAAQRDLAEVRSLLTQPGSFLAFSNGDPGANNFIATSDGGRLIDFEYARFRHALIDAACMHVQHSVWMTIADPAPYGVIDIYRTELAAHIPQAADDTLFATAMAGAAAMRAIERLRRLAKLDARPAGDESRRQMIATIESAAATVSGYGVLTDLGGWLTDVSSALRRRWPDADTAFPNRFTVR